MKWHRLSEAGNALLRQLAEDSDRWLGRSRRIVHSMQALCDLGEPAAIPSIVAFLLDDDATVAWEASVTVQALLARVPPALLPILDERMRAIAYWVSSGDPWRSLSPAALGCIHAGANVPLLLGLASFHGNGYLRECAVIRLDHEVTSGWEIPFLLLRLGDWVAAVRTAAEKGLGHRIMESNRAAFLECLPLIVRLGARSRAGVSATLGRVHEFLQGDIPVLAAAAIESPDSGARHFGLSLAWAAASTAGNAAHRALIEQVVESESPAARLDAANWLAGIKTPLVLAQQFLPKLVHDRFAVVRRLALGWCAAREPHAHLESLRAALLDPSAMVRAVAQFHLPKQVPIDPRRFYRDAIGGSDRRVLKSALGGLGETGRSDDADLIVPFVNAPEIGVRKAALAALARLALEQHLELFVQALQDKSPSVSRQARIVMEPLASKIGDNRISVIFAGTTYPHVRVQALSLGHRLARWEKLPLLVQANAEPDEALKMMAADMLPVWLRGHNTTYFVEPSEGEIAQFNTALAAYGAKLKPEVGRQLKALARIFHAWNKNLAKSPR